MKRYYWKKQQPVTSYCGQLAVSIILKKTLKETIKLFGNDKPTSTNDLIRVLKSQKIKCDNKLRRKRKNLAIAKLTYPHKNTWHWVVVYNDKIFDGIHGNRDGTVYWDKKWRLISYLNIE